MSYRCVKEGVTRLYARKFQGMLNYQGVPRSVSVLGSVKACQGM